MKTRPTKTKLLTALLTLCMLLSLVPISAFAAEYDFLPEGVEYTIRRGGTHTYYTRVDVTANVSVKDSEGTVLETTQVSKSSGDFIEGIHTKEDAQPTLANLQAEIEASYKAKGTVTSEKGNGQMFIGHLESPFYAFTPTSGDTVDFGSDLEAAKLYFREHPDATGTFTETTDARQYQKYEYTYDLTVQENSQSTNTITSAAVQNVKFDYQSGDAPQATAWVAVDDTDKYEIAYECWQQFENNEPVAAWYSDNGSHGSLPTITKFEGGKKYVYFVMLKQKDGYSFSSETAVTVNGESVKSSLSGEFLYVPAVKSINPVERKPIELIEISDVTTSFKVGDTPVFTGKVSADALYYIDYEGWNSKDAGVTSSEYWNDRYGDFEGSWGKLLASFEANTEYTYRIYLKLTDEAVKSGYYFDKGKTKLSINGKIMDMREDSISIEPYPYDDVAMFYCVLTMTPEAGGTTPSEKYTVTYTDGVDGEEIFKDQTYTVESGKATPAFNGAPARKGYTFAGWKPAVAATVTGNATYEATWKSNSTTTTPSGNKPNTGETTSPKTGDTSNMLLWFALLFVSGGAAIGTTVVSRKKKYNR